LCTPVVTPTVLIDQSTLWLFAVASAAIVIVPGPTVTLIIANSLRVGTRAGLMNVAGTQVGLALMLVILAFGFSAIIESMSVVFDVIRVLGAAYLIWLGWKLLRAQGEVLAPSNSQIPTRHLMAYFWQGFLVIWSNPKALFLFGAFIPQFVDRTQPAVPQVAVLGFTFMAVGFFFDGGYAVAAGKTAAWLRASHIKWLERISGTCLIAGGIWLLCKRDS